MTTAASPAPGNAVVRSPVVRRGGLIPLLTVLLTVIGAACGSGTGDNSGFSKIPPDTTRREIDDFARSGFKKTREYDVTGLPGAISAHRVYFTPGGSEPLQYEFRFYPDHATAVEKGVEYADEVSGPDALLREVDVRWKEGTRDRRGGGAFRDSLTPLYGDFAVFGNVILLCEGRDSDQSLDRCAALVRAAGIDVEG